MNVGAETMALKTVTQIQLSSAVGYLAPLGGTAGNLLTGLRGNT